MNKTTTVCMMVVALAGMALAAPKFEKVPDQANEMLKGSRGRPFSAGLVFSNGHYLKPPYRVARYGTAIFVNDVQISGQVVPWRSFLATQEGYVSPAASAKKAGKPAEKKAEEATEDLFDDGSAKEAEKKQAEAAAAAAEERGAFVPNEKSDRLKKKIDNYRVEVQGKLKRGDICFFGVRYGSLIVPSREALKLLETLPEAISDANGGADLFQNLRARGFAYMSRPLCDDLIENRADYLLLVERREQMRKDKELAKILDGGKR